MFYRLLLVLIFVSQTLSQERIFGLVGQGISETLKVAETVIRIGTQFSSDIICNFISQSFETQRKFFGKFYATKEELEKRLSIFTNSCQSFLQQNMLAQIGLATYETGINQFSDMTTEEVLKKYCNLKVKPETLKNRRSLKRNYRFVRQTKGATDVPESWDWRDFNIVAPIKDQKSCGSCWAFSSCSALESHLMKTELVRKKSFDVVNLSEQNLIDCSSGHGNEGCDGGLMVKAFNYIKEHGIMKNRDYPYNEASGECNYKSDKKFGSCNGYEEIEPYDEEALKRYLYLKGPICCAVSVTDDFIRYRSGVFNDSACPIDKEAINHAVVIVGYGKTDTNMEYWIVRNSWGKSWGEKGYIRIMRNQNNVCNIATYCGYPVVENNLDSDKSWFAKINFKSGIKPGSTKCFCT